MWSIASEVLHVYRIAFVSIIESATCTVHSSSTLVDGRNSLPEQPSECFNDRFKERHQVEGAGTFFCLRAGQHTHLFLLFSDLHVPVLADRKSLSDETTPPLMQHTGSCTLLLPLIDNSATKRLLFLDRQFLFRPALAAKD